MANLKCNLSDASDIFSTSHFEPSAINQCCGFMIYKDNKAEIVKLVFIKLLIIVR